MIAELMGIAQKFDQAVLGINRAFVNIAVSQTDAVVVAAVAKFKIRVLSVVMQTGATATTATFRTKPAGAGTDISMDFQNGANGGEVLPFNPSGWFETNVDEGLSIDTGAGSVTGIQVQYMLVRDPAQF